MAVSLAISSAISLDPTSWLRNDIQGETKRKVDGLNRVFTAADTYTRLQETGKALGITRIADITGLDRIGIPVFSSIVPSSEDFLSVYNGKGLRPIDAKAGALMEAIERQTALKVRLPYVEASYAELSLQSHTLNPWRVIKEISEDFTAESQCAWVQGMDIFSDQLCWVPAKLAGYIWDDLPGDSPYTTNDTNGLASGNTRLEAICHALCEIVERDAWTFAELAAKCLPAVRRYIVEGEQSEGGQSKGARPKSSDDLEFFPCVDVPPEVEVFQVFLAAGLQPQVREITSSLQIPAFLASVVDESISGFPMVHLGFGAHPNAEVALRRSLTEVAQSRCVDIQSVREDILPPHAPVEEYARHTRRTSAVNRRHWALGQSRTRRPFEAIKSHCFEDLEMDLRFLMDRLKAGGLSEAIVVDFTPGCTTHSVVRVIVPGTESWAMDHGRLGQRAVEFWKQNA